MYYTYVVLSLVPVFLTPCGLEMMYYILYPIVIC